MLRHFFSARAVRHFSAAPPVAPPLPVPPDGRLADLIFSAPSLPELAALAARAPLSAPHHVRVCLTAARLRATDLPFARTLFFASARAWLAGDAAAREGRDAAALCQAAARLELSAAEAAVFFPQLLASAARLSACPSFQGKHAAVVLAAAAAVGAGGGAASLPALFRAAARLAHTFSAREASLALWAAGRLAEGSPAGGGEGGAGAPGGGGGGGGGGARPPAEAAHALAEAARRAAAGCGPHDAALLAWGAAALQLAAPRVLRPVFAAAARTAGDMNARDAAMAWGAAAAAGVGDASLLAPLAGAVARSAPALSPRELVDALEAAAALSGARWGEAAAPGDATGALLRAVAAAAAALSLRGAARALWAAAALGAAGLPAAAAAAPPLRDAAVAALAAARGPPSPDVAALLLRAHHLGAAPLPPPAAAAAAAALRATAAPQGRGALGGAEGAAGRAALAAGLARLGWGPPAEAWLLDGLLFAPLVAACPATGARVAVEFHAPAACLGAAAAAPARGGGGGGGGVAPLRIEAQERLTLLALPATGLRVAAVHGEVWARCGGRAAAEDALLARALRGARGAGAAPRQ